MRVRVLGKELSPEELEKIPEGEPPYEAHFIEPTVSAKAIDRASQIVPKQFWENLGISTWLTNRAKEAFAKLPATKRMVDHGRLKYVFTFVDDKPVLDTVILLPS
jgi:hypothetical protein